MSEELLVEVNGFETRVALLRDGGLVELHLHRPAAGESARSNGRIAAGNIYAGRVERVVPALQAVFVDIGAARPGFLRGRDIAVSHTRTKGAPARLADRVQQGQRLLVQVAREPMQGKPARLTANLALASRLLVLRPLTTRVRVSSGIDGVAERQRLKDLVEAARHDLDLGYGCIVRTAAATASGAELRAALELLHRQWQRIVAHGVAATNGGRTLLYEEPPLPTRMVRDLAGPALAAIVVDDAAAFKRLAAYVDSHLPTCRPRLRRYRGAPSLLKAYGVDAAIDQAVDHRVALPSGGGLVIERTESMTVIDVNSGSNVAAATGEVHAVATNREAAAVIAAELRRRNIGGIIVVDFIAMHDDADRQAVLEALRAAAAGDAAPMRVSGFSALGLVEISRRRIQPSLAEQLCEPCSTCAGTGYVKSARSVCYDIFRSVRRVAAAQSPSAAGRQTPPAAGGQRAERQVVVRAHQRVVDCLLGDEAERLADVADAAGRDIRVQAEPGYAMDRFEVAPR